MCAYMRMFLKLKWKKFCTWSKLSLTVGIVEFVCVCVCVCVPVRVCMHINIHASQALPYLRAYIHTHTHIKLLIVSIKRILCEVQHIIQACAFLCIEAINACEHIHSYTHNIHTYTPVPQALRY
jgi:hypothetical protein